MAVNMNDDRRTRISSRGQIVIPKALRQKYGLSEGEEVVWEEEDGKLVLRKADWKDYANEIARKMKQAGITEEDMLEELERVRKELYDEWKNK
jgi:antitoxin PrlF